MLVFWKCVMYGLASFIWGIPKPQFSSVGQGHRCLYNPFRGSTSSSLCKARFSSYSSTKTTHQNRFGALAGVVQWGKHQPGNRKVASLILSQWTCLGCKPGPWLVVCARGNQPHIDVSLLLSPPSSLSRKINKSLKKKNILSADADITVQLAVIKQVSKEIYKNMKLLFFSPRLF